MIIITALVCAEFPAQRNPVDVAGQLTKRFHTKPKKGLNMLNSRLAATIFMISINLGLFSTSIGNAKSGAMEEVLSIKKQSSFFDDVDNQKYKEIAAPENPVQFRWDFSGNKIYSYDFRQEVISENFMSSFGPDKGNTISSQKMIGNGTLSYKSEKDNIARFVLENLKLKSESSVKGDDSEPKTMEMASPPLIIQGVKEDGNLSIPSNAQTLLLKLLFPLPERPMKVSETICVQVSMPFNAMGSLLQVKGGTQITLTKFVNINGHNCAKLISDIDISKLDVPTEIKGKFFVGAKGKSVFYFDIDNRKFIEGKLALLIAMDIEAQTPKVTFPGEKGKTEKIPETMKIVMNTDSLISLKSINSGKIK